MPDFTLGQLISNATKRVGYRADLSLSDCSFWANQAIQDFVRDVPELLSESKHWFSLSSGDSIVSLNTDWVETLSISHQSYGESHTQLRQMRAEDCDQKGYYPLGTPKGYFIYNNQIQIWPSADSSAATTAASSGRSYLHRYKSYPEDLVSLTSTPKVAYEHRKGILYKTEVHLHELLGNLEEAALSEARYVNYVSTLKDSMAKRQAARSRFAASLTLRKSRMPGIGAEDDDDIWLRK